MRLIPDMTERERERERKRERVVRTPLSVITKPSQHKGDLTKVDV